MTVQKIEEEEEERWDSHWMWMGTVEWDFKERPHLKGREQPFASTKKQKQSQNSIFYIFVELQSGLGSVRLIASIGLQPASVNDVTADNNRTLKQDYN